ncbi:hypothetical protein B0A79_15475 [Flavobacterium piscis]|uniref:Uncharacterized protein n=1 Tax=Flavobacterium piscis TaxID=1114874 RepID=A0ABX2XPK3_9FLAO|nr:hypothetical protein [Flavobacterium piscis]OCB78207.1 hypothetical protein FLP_00430 [Flavobacterium piscis]OXG02349.1 hypothetical protein B0A79_15475 [Flavobacterium piscis]
MEKYIILLDCEDFIIDLHCEFFQINNICTVTIANPFDSTFVISEDLESRIYAQAAKYILDKGRIISIIPAVEKHPHNFFSAYIRVEQINRHLLRFKEESH